MPLRVLEEESARARADRAERVLVEVERGQHEHPRFGKRFYDRLGRGDPVQPRHPDVHQHDVRSVLSRSPDGLLAIACLADHDHVGFRFEHQAEADADEFLIIDEEYADGVGHGASSISSTVAPEATCSDATGSSARRTHRSSPTGPECSVPFT